MDKSEFDPTFSEPWRDRMVDQVLPGLNEIGKNLAGAWLRPRDPNNPSPQELATVQAAADLLDLGQRFLTSCLTLEGAVPLQPNSVLDQMTEQELMDALARKTGQKIYNATQFEPVSPSPGPNP